jgi:hypothetical protein
MTLTFNGAARLIVRDDTAPLSVRDLWSEWVRWHATGDNGKYPMAFRLLGGDQIDPAQGTAVPFYVYLQNGWAIRPHEADHAFAVTDGILLVDGGGDPFVPTLGGYTVRVNYQQPVQAVAVEAAGATPASIAAAVWAHLFASGNTAQAELLAAKAAAGDAFAVSA